MRVLPREHGATVIWLASLVLALGAITATPSPVRLAAFVTAAVLALLFLARLTSGSVAVMRMERHAVLLPALSGFLTLVVPAGELVVLGRLTPPVLAAWLLFATYTVAGVVLTRAGVRAILKRRTPAMAGGVLCNMTALAEAVARESRNLGLDIGPIDSVSEPVKGAIALAQRLLTSSNAP